LLEPVCRLYRLSRVETKLVSYLAQGKTLSDSSALMRIKDQTARSYMKQIFVKTSTNRQNELIVLMLSSVVRTRSGLIQTALEASKIPAD
jgi:DNA-binding CsgD family transcriptional regulator